MMLQRILLSTLTCLPVLGLARPSGAADAEPPPLHASYSPLFVVGNTWEYTGKSVDDQTNERTGRSKTIKRDLAQTCRVTAVQVKPTGQGADLHAVVTCTAPGKKAVAQVSEYVASAAGLLRPTWWEAWEGDLAVMIPLKPREDSIPPPDDSMTVFWSVSLGRQDVPTAGACDVIKRSAGMPMGSGASQEAVFAVGVGLVSRASESTSELFSSKRSLSLVAFHPAGSAGALAAEAAAGKRAPAKSAPTKKP